MPCFRCERIQEDPVRGKSPWARFVLKGEQVLMCPQCQSEAPDWKDLGDRCRNCGSTRLVVMLDSVVCKSCTMDFDRESYRPPVS